MSPMGRKTLLGVGAGGAVLPLTDLVQRFRSDGPLWQDSGRTTAATAGDDPVGAWDDLVGSNHALQATAGLRPILKLAVQNGRAAVEFDGTDDWLQELGLAVNQPSTVFFVCRYLNTGVSLATAVDGGGQNSARFFLSTATQLGVNAGASLLLAVNLGAWHVYRATFNGASSAAQVDGGTPVTGNAGANNRSGITLGARGTDELSNANVQVGEVLTYDAALSDSAIAQANDFLRGYWGTP